MTIGKLQIENIAQHNGFTCLSSSKDNFKPQWFKTSQLESINKYININSHYDVYASQSTFIELKRKGGMVESNIQEINSIFIDIDNHLTQDESIAKNINEGLKSYYGYEIPQPSYTQLSGRGLHLIYFLEGASDVIKWRLVANALARKIDTLLPKVDAMGSLYTSKAIIKTDKSVLVPHKYARIDGSYNTKAHKYAQVLNVYDVKYTLDEIIEEYPSLSTSKNNLKAIRGLKPNEIVNYTSKQLNTFKPYAKRYTIETLNRARIIDLRTLQNVRKLKGYDVGYRSVMIGIMVQLLLAYYDDLNEILEELESFNYNFSEPLSDNEVMAWYKSALQNKQNYTNKKIIEKLDITLEEENKLLAIISVKTKNKRYRAMHKDKIQEVQRNYTRRKREPQRQINKAKLLARNNAIKQDRANGLSYKELETKYTLQKRQLYRIVKSK